jgi:hypothetical protein
MNPMAVAMTGFAFALWVNALALLRAGWTAKGAGSVQFKAMGIAGSLPGAIGLLFAAVWFVVGRPFGGREAWALHALFSSIVGLYGFLWLGIFAVQVFGLDWRPIGDLCLLGAIIQAIQIIAVFHLLGMGLHIWISAIVLVIYLVWLILLSRLLSGKLPPRTVGWWSILATIGSLYLLFVGGGIFPHP